MAEPQDRILAAHPAHWPLGGHSGRQVAGWAPWPGLYGPARSQDRSVKYQISQWMCSDVEIDLCIYGVYNQSISPSRLEENKQLYIFKPTLI